MASFLLLIVCLILGVLVARIGNPPNELSRSLNWWVLYIALPATVLELIPHLVFDTSLWFLVAGMWLVFLGTWLLFHHLGKWLGWSHSTIGAVVLCAGLSNTGFVGFPLLEALRGKEVLSYAALADQAGCFLAMSVGGSLVVALYSGHKTNARAIARKIVMFPPLIALVVAIFVAMTPGWPPIVEAVLARISATLAPLALFSVGLQLQFRLAAHRITPLLTGLVWKLGIAPLLIFGIGMALQIPSGIFTVTLLEAAMAPMISAAILAEQNELDPPLANMLVGLGIVLSFITVPLWNLLV